YEKRGKLRTLVADHEAALLELVRSLRSAEGMATFRPAFGKLVNSDVNRSIVIPSLPDDFTRQTFEELLGGCQSVLDSSDASMISEADEFVSHCRELADEGESLGSFYSEELIGTFTKTLASLVRRHVS